MSHPADHVRFGLAHLRDHRADRPPHLRNVVAGARVVDDAGEIRTTEAGDLLNWAHWAAAQAAGAGSEEPAGAASESEAPREVGAWSFAWPARSGDGALLPIRDGGVSRDERFEPIPLKPAPTGESRQTRPSGPAAAEPAVSLTGRPIPDDARGVMLAGTDEREPGRLFLPVCELIAQHAGDSPAEFSTPVFDIAPDSRRIDRNRPAGLHGHWWLAQTPDGGALGQTGAWLPAWNLARSASDATGYGAIVAPPDGGGQAAAYVSWLAFGPIHPGHRDDAHQIGRSDAGVPVNSAHIWTEALYYRDQCRDGPLEFESGPYPPCGDNAVPTRVHLVFDEGVQHAWLGGPRRGKWRWYTTTAIRPPWRPPHDPPRDPPWDPPWEPPVDPPTPTPGGTDADDGPTLPPGARPPGRSGGGRLSGGDDAAGGRLKPWREPLDPGPGYPVDPARTPWELALPSLYGTGVRRPGAPYDGRFGGPGWIDTIDGLTPDWSRAPLVWHLQGFGAVTDTGAPDATIAADGFYKSPTCAGGAWFTPPEILLDGVDAPAAVSDTTLLLYNGSRGGSPVTLGWGEPTAAGSFVDGPALIAGSGSGARDLTLTFRDAAGSARPNGALNLNGRLQQSGELAAAPGRPEVVALTAENTLTIASGSGTTAGSLIGARLTQVASGAAPGASAELTGVDVDQHLAGTGSGATSAAVGMRHHATGAAPVGATVVGIELALNGDPPDEWVGLRVDAPAATPASGAWLIDLGSGAHPMLAASAGSGANTYLRVRVAGATYKLALLNAD
jgi:hypothetical protein